MYLLLPLREPVALHTVGQFIAPDAEWRHKPRRLDHYVLQLVVAGEYCIEEDGVRYTLTPGNAILLEPGREHCGWRPSEATFYWMHFTPRLPCQRLPVYPENPDPFAAVLPKVHTLSSCPRQVILFHELMHITSLRSTHPLEGDYRASELLLSLDDGRSAASGAPDGDKKINQIIEWIRVNPGRFLSVREIAERLNYSPEYLSRYFKSRVGMTIKEYINSQKIQVSKALLLSSTLSVKEISGSIGFADANYFVKLFKSREGLTPSQYRASVPTLHQNRH